MGSRKTIGLGKGLGAIIGDLPDMSATRRQPVGYVNKQVVGTKPVQNYGDILRIPVELIEANPFQPRQDFDETALAELAESIRNFGLIQPISVRKVGDRYQIISGERRFRASKMVGMDIIPAYVRDADDQGMLEMAIVENIQRKDLDPIEVAMSYQRLMDECSLTQEQMAARVGRNRTSVANTLRLLRLPAKVQHDLKEGLVSIGHAKALLSLEDAHVQELLCDLTISQGLSVRQLEEKVRKIVKGTETKPSVNKAQELPDDYYRMLEHIGKFFDNSISLKRSASGKGTMTIRFSSDEEVSRFLKALEDSDI
ncbi:MAG: ParB/RepB/Spo0J family partition protein [Bacteroidales bacterium]|nr:ParB/RepB/Spo0J family partition protein [Bacteroidales bacterium]